ncbi:sigma-70 family RNA polymerase sigma factor [Streptomyces meridianus]|uniref:Sigma-70 family RNA polymerase sigma factor n=1 Tax=Streptomyces meridianus TaxID=2938945 RepID=A0ABT0X3I6_9ACTN|nr:sigma-70 family RNA polymerase sigma factor [Streptomyces meridianus]MCM2577093.1 sigma-70 family RNA polymerase sigma factor [Streptomyces meridianus]
MTFSDLFTTLRPLLAVEASAEAHGHGVDAEDLEQGVWLRLLERTRWLGPPAAPAAWLRTAVRTEARAARRRNLREVPYGRVREAGPYEPRCAAPSLEDRVVAADAQRTLRSAVRRLPGRCPRLLAVMLSPADLTYREVADALDISQGSLGPVRSRCLSCLRRMLAAEIATPQHRGRKR